ncbi:MAG: cobalamin-dependent protein [Candidatus Bathyarchaeota archaeon]|nr:MAG: cobalamin-dependent protein [Candidatus Bathyarchaeota archaeon]
MGKLAEAMGKLDKKSVIEIVRQELNSGKDPLEIIEELRKGMEIVGEGFEKLERFLMDLIWASEIFKDAAALIMPKIKEKMKNVPVKGKVVIGTVKGDIHDIGKNLVMALLECAGFKVLDLGVDIAPEVFVEKIKAYKPQIVGMSGLLTASIDVMQETIQAIEKEGLRKGLKIIVGGGVVGDKWTKGKVNADATVTSAVEGVKLAEEYVGAK